MDEIKAIKELTGVLVGDGFSYKVTSYATTNDYSTALPIEVAAGWHPLSVINWTSGLGNVILVTYRSRA